jgi:polyhydroxyalkanoate synthesis repressor PhaR
LGLFFRPFLHPFFPEDPVKNPEVLIRKYSDRRLYDTGASRYVKLEDIARMVRDGIDVRVVDARSGKDLTHVVLTQIIVEDARERQIALPLQLLTQLVRASDKATHDFLTWYLNSTLDLYKKAQDTVQTRLSDAKSAVTSPLEFVRNLLSGQSWPPPASRSGEVEELKRRVEELQSRLQKQDKPLHQTPRRAAKRKRATR